MKSILYFILINFALAEYGLSSELFFEDGLPVKAVIFDCDGVLVDTELLKYKAWKAAADEQGISFSLAEYKPLVGQSAEHISQAIKNLQLKKGSGKAVNERLLLSTRNTTYREYQHLPHGIPLIQPAIKLAQDLNEKKDHYGIKLGLASSAPHAEIKINLKACGLEQTFDFVISSEDDLQDIQDNEGTNKPKPYIYQRLAKWMTVKPKHAVVLEDTNAGICAATSANMVAYAVPNRFTEAHDFNLAYKIIDSEKEMTINKLFIIREIRR